MKRFTIIRVDNVWKNGGDVWMRAFEVDSPTDVQAFLRRCEPGQYLVRDTDTGRVETYEVINHREVKKL